MLVSGDLFCSFDRAMPSCALLFFAVIYAFEKTATSPVFMDWLHTGADFPQPAWLEVLEALKPCPGMCFLWTCVL